jgi:hypothetical protein
MPPAYFVEFGIFTCHYFILFGDPLINADGAKLRLAFSTTRSISLLHLCMPSFYLISQNELPKSKQ